MENRPVHGAIACCVDEGAGGTPRVISRGAELALGRDGGAQLGCRRRHMWMRTGYVVVHGGRAGSPVHPLILVE